MIYRSVPLVRSLRPFPFIAGLMANWYERQNRLRQRGTLFIFFTNMLHEVQHVCEKAWNLPPCRRRIGPFDQADACLVNDRVSRVCEYYPGIMGETTRNTRHYYDNEILLTVETQRAQR